MMRDDTVQGEEWGRDLGSVGFEVGHGMLRGDAQVGIILGQLP